MNFDIYVDLSKLNQLIEDDKGINSIDMIKIKVKDGEYNSLSTYHYSGVLHRFYKSETFKDEELVGIKTK